MLVGALQLKTISVYVAVPDTLVGSEGKEAAIIDKGVDAILDPTELVA